MSLLGNILWILFGGGILICLEYALGGLLLCLTVVGIPFGIQCFKLAGHSLFPFGHRVVTIRPLGDGVLLTAMNVVWIIFAGLWIAITHVLLAISLAVSIIGIPFAIQHIKLAEISFAPFGKTME